MEYTFILTCSVALFYTWTVLAIGSIQKRHHDGRTVTQMLAEIGEGPGLQSNWSVTSKECENGTEGCDDDGLRSIRVLIMPDEGTKELCWGYEKKCNKEKRLFVPHCDEPSRPWCVESEFMFIVIMHGDSHTCKHKVPNNGGKTRRVLESR